MSLSSWRQFSFFGALPIRDPNYGSEDALYSDSTVSAICPTPDYLVIATNQSTIKLINKSFQLQYQFTAYELGWSITKLQYLDTGNNSGYLCSIGEFQGQPTTLKLWDLKKLITSNKPIDFASDFHTQVQIMNGQNNYPMTSFAASSDFSILAFGFGNGVVTLVRGDLLHDRGSRQRVVYESKDPITGIFFKDESVMYVTTVSKVLTIPTTGRNQGRPDKILEDKLGVDIGCSDVSKDSKRNLIVAKDDSIAFYTSKSHNYSIMLDIPKRKLFAYGSKYVVLVSPVTNTTSIAENGITGDVYLTTKIYIVDIVNKFIAFSQTISNSVTEIFEMWGNIYMLTTDGLLIKVHEKTLKEKIDIVVQRELFPIAIKLAESATSADKLEETAVTYIRKQYGDYLYDKEEFQEAIDQYVHCFSLGKTSEVIQKYKGNSKLIYLTYYLEKMMEMKFTKEDHVTLLLCSYCKLKQTDKLKQFVEDIEIDEFYEITEHSKRFNLDVVTNLCRETEYYHLAALMAKKFNQPSIVVDILIRDLSNAENAMNYIETLQIDDLLRVLIDNVSILLEMTPNRTLALLIDVFTGKYQHKPEVSLEDATAVIEKPIELQQNYPVLQSYKAFVSFMGLENLGSTSGSTDKSSSSDLGVAAPTYLPPRPRIVFSSFVNHPNEFVIFLEACVESYDKFGVNKQDKADIFITLYEIYLTMASNVDSEKDNSAKQIWETKAKELSVTLKKEYPENADMLLLLSNMNDFNEGEILARDEPGFEIDLFRSRMAAGDLEGVKAVLKKYGPTENELYKLAFSYYLSSKSIFKQITKEEFKNLLEQIKTLRLMSPLELIQTASMTDVATVGLIKDYLFEYISLQKQEISNNEALINSYKEETKSIKSEILKLLTEPVTIQNTKCNSCSQKLDLPTIHFKCGHSYHERCLSEFINNQDSNELMGTESGSNLFNTYSELTSNTLMKCPLCVSELDAISVLRKHQEEIGERNDLFKAALTDSTDRFRIMTTFFGRGAMDQSKVSFTE